MATLDIIILFIVGLLLIIKGGDWFVDGSIWIAKKTGIPSLIIGATIVSIGTTIPEICVSVFSVIKSFGVTDPIAKQGLFEMSIGNAIGSMMCNIGVILAVVLLVRPPKTKGFSFNWKALYLTLCSTLLVIFSFLDGKLGMIEGIILLSLFCIFIIANVFEADKHIKKYGNEISIEEKAIVDKQNPAKMIAMLVFGAAAIALGANLLVDKGQALALIIGIPTQIIAITFVAIGTSLPELVTAITSIKKKDANIGIGNIIGANIINCTLLLGLASTISGSLPIDHITKTVGIFIMLTLTIIVLIPPLIKNRTYRWQGVLLLCTYLGFVTYNIIYVVQNLH
ncbi:MAG: calcium/sodium antiporter [Clostridia bacterium]